MYSAYYTTTLGVRPKSAFSYSHLSLWLDSPSSSSSSPSCHCCCCASELVPRGVPLIPSSLYGRILRQSARRRLGAVSHRPSLYRDGSFIEGLLAQFQGSYSETLCFRSRNDEMGYEKMGSWETDSIPEGRYQRRSVSGRNGSVSSKYSLSSSSFSAGFGATKTKQRRFNGEDSGRDEVRRTGSNSYCYSSSSSGYLGASGTGEDKLRRAGGELCGEGGKDEARGSHLSSVHYFSSSRDVGGREVKERRVDEKLNRGFRESGQGKIGKKVDLKDVQEVCKFQEDDLGTSSFKKASERKVRRKEEEEELLTRSGYDREQCVREDHQLIDGLSESKEGSRKGVRIFKASENDRRGGLSLRKVSESEYEGRDEHTVEDKQHFAAERELREEAKKHVRIFEGRKDEVKRGSASRRASDSANRKIDENIASGSREGIRKGVRITELNEDDTRWELDSRRKVSESAHECIDEYAEGEQCFVAKKDASEGYRIRVYEGDENDRRRNSSYNKLVDTRKIDFNASSSSAIRRRSNRDQQVVGLAESQRSSQNLTDLTDIRDSNLERSSICFEEASVKNREDSSTSLQYSDQLARDRSTHITQEAVDQMYLRNQREDRTNVSKVSQFQKHLEDTRSKGGKERSTSVQTVVQVARDKSTQTDEQTVDRVKLTEQYSNHTNSQLTDREQKFTSVQNSVQLVSNQQEVDRGSITKQYKNQLDVSNAHAGANEDARSSRRVSGSIITDQEENLTSAGQIHGSREQQNQGSEQVNRERILRLESRQNDEASEFGTCDIEGVSSSRQKHTSTIESQNVSSSAMLVQNKEKQGTNTGESSSSTEARTAFSGSSDGGSSSIYTHVLELDDQTSRDEMYQVRVDDALGSLRRQDMSSAVYIGEFVDKLQQEISVSGKSQMEEEKSQAAVGVQVGSVAVTGSQEDSKNIRDDPRQFSSRSAPKGPSDEMWDVKGQSSQELSRIEEPEEYSSPVGFGDSTATSVSETAISRRSHRSLWAYIADLIRKGLGSQAGSDNSIRKLGARSASNESVDSEAWFSGHEPDENDEETDRKGKNAKQKELAPVKRPLSHASPTMHPVPSPEISGEPRREDGIPLLGGDMSMPAGLEHDSVSGSVSVISKLETKVLVEAEQGRQGINSTAVTFDDSVASRNDKSSSAIQEEVTEVGNLLLPRSEIPKVEEEVIRGESPQVGEPAAKDTELKRRKFQRNKQVLKETFDEWEEAYKLETEQRKVDEHFMREALVEARKGADIWEVPVGAVLVHNGKIIARGCNLVEELRDSTAHAEMICIREASNLLRTWRLAETTLYVTLEPCAMCAGAILQARVDTVVWGAPNKLLGADGSWVRLFPGDAASNSLDQSERTAGPVHPFHPKITTRRGILGTECSELMQQFFKLRRKKEKKTETPPPCLPNYGTKLVTKMHDIFSVMFCL